jgi:hypothetical protein
MAREGVYDTTSQRGGGSAGEAVTIDAATGEVVERNHWSAIP